MYCENKYGYSIQLHKNIPFIEYGNKITSICYRWIKNVFIHRIGGWWPWLVGGWYGKNGHEPLIFSADLALIVTLGGNSYSFF